MLKSTLKREEQRFEKDNEIIPSNTLEVNSVERQMLVKYVLSWNEVALSYRANKMYSESLEAFQTAIPIYNKLNLKIHSTFALGDSYLS